jgi:hypothetical protein
MNGRQSVSHSRGHNGEGFYQHASARMPWVAYLLNPRNVMGWIDVNETPTPFIQESYGDIDRSMQETTCHM